MNDINYTVWKRVLSRVNDSEDLSCDNLIRKIEEQLELENKSFDFSSVAIDLDAKFTFSITYKNNEDYSFSCSLISLAAKSGCEKVVDTLVQLGADPNIVDCDGWNLFHYAVSGSVPHIVPFLLRLKVEINARDLSGATPLYFAIENEDKNMAIALLECGADPNIVDCDGLTPLHLAAKSQCDSLATILLEQGEKKAYVEVVSRLDYSTPLHYAARGSSLSLVKKLLEKGASISARDIDRMLPLHISAKFDFSEAISSLLLVSSKDKDSSNRYSLTYPGVQFLGIVTHKSGITLEDAITFDTVAKFKNAPLHISAEFYSQEAAVALINVGASIDLKNKEGRTPLHVSAIHNNVDCARLLIQKGASLDLSDLTGDTPLHLAVERCNVDLVELLLSYKASIKAQNLEKKGPLHLAAEQGMTDVVDFLINKGMD
ncbi:ankyrin repeat domain-containing protein, partial [Wolbachia endosymbiont of Nasonia vitripennis]